MNQWSTNIFDCSKDEESCWWGAWCCWLVSARNEETWKLGSSFRHSCSFVTFVVCVLLLLKFAPILAVSLLIIGMVTYGIYRARLRNKIRNASNIPGSFIEDMMLHFCCSCCAVCQEARQAKSLNMIKLDFCFGQELEIVDEVAVEGVVLDEHLLPEDATFLHRLKFISKTSRLLLVCALGLLVLVPLVTKQTVSTMFVVLLVFVQPLVVLYVFYWRTNRKHCLLDYVIKLFVCGFAVATTQSMFFESFLQLLFGLALAVALAVFDPTTLTDLTKKSSSSTNMLSSDLLRHVGSLMNSQHDTNYYVTSRDDVFSDGTSLGVNSTLHTLQHMGLTASNSSSLMDSVSSSTARHYLLLGIVAMFFMAFVVAAGVEETMKHFVVRCCRFPEPLKNPHTVMVYMLCGALGFATAENLEYVFGAETSQVPGTSLLVGELTVLLMRVCLPVHLICSVLQAANYSKVVVGGVNMNTFMVLLPALLLHGTFDFSLFLLGLLEFAYSIDSVGFTVLSLATPVAITIAGIFWAQREHSKVVREFENGWERAGTDEDIDLVDGQL